MTPIVLAKAQDQSGVSKFVAPIQMLINTNKKPIITIHAGGQFCTIRAIG